ncbi:hypothetical protein Vafri_20780, partial [Volvox africanus]
MPWFARSILLLLLSPRRKDSRRSSRSVPSNTSNSLGRATQIVNVNVFRCDNDNVATDEGDDDKDDDLNITATTDSATQIDPLSVSTADWSNAGSITSLPSPLLHRILIIAS